MDMIEQHAFEVQREERWWATYNAAVTGFLAAPDGSLPEDFDLHESAAKVATDAHGEIKGGSK